MMDSTGEYRPPVHPAHSSRNIEARDAAADDRVRAFAPASSHESGGVYAGYLDRGEILTVLNKLLESERAGARAAVACSAASEEPVRSALREIAQVGTWFCAMLSRHIEGLGGRPSTATASFLGKFLAIGGTRERLVFLNRRQAWIVRKLRDALPRVHDDLLREELRDMLELHEANIGRCERALSR